MFQNREKTIHRGNFSKGLGFFFMTHRVFYGIDFSFVGDVVNWGKFAFDGGYEPVGDDNNDESGSVNNGLRTSISPVWKQNERILFFVKSNKKSKPEQVQDIHKRYNLHQQVLHHRNHRNELVLHRDELYIEFKLEKKTKTIERIYFSCAIICWRCCW